jgi:hypothetical protein
MDGPHLTASRADTANNLEGPRQVGVSFLPCETACVFVDMTVRRTNIIGPGQSVCYVLPVAALAFGLSESGLVHGDGRLDFFVAEVPRPGVACQQTRIGATWQSSPAEVRAHGSSGLLQPSLPAGDGDGLPASSVMLIQRH